MGKLSDRYGDDVVSALVRDYGSNPEDTEVKDPTENPFDQIDVRKPITSKDTTPFTKIFGYQVCETIPDLEFKVYKDSDWHEDARIHIPDLNPNWVWNKPALERFALAMHEGDTTLLHGLQGTGKSCLAEQWCATLRIPFWRMSCNKETREQHFLGSPSLSYDEKGQAHIAQEPTLLTDSLRYGGMFCEDEAFRHNAALVLQSLRERTNRTVILPDAPGKTAAERLLKAPKNWWYVLTDNTCGSGDETGVFDAEVQDASTLDRIDTVIEVKYLPKPQERTMLKRMCGLNDDIINGMLDLAKMVRVAFEKQHIMCTMSVRGLESWANKIELTGNIGTGLMLSWYNKLGSDDQKVV